MKDLFGQALYDFWHDNHPEDMITATDLTSEEVLPVSYLFRSFEQMPLPEQKALEMAKGKILDVGAGSGTHTLWLQEHRKDVTALEISEISCGLMRERGVVKVVQADFFQFNNQKFDTLLFLMNGVGIIKKAENLDKLFQKIDTLLQPNGQALIHSSDLKYLYENETAGYNLPVNSYYGDVTFYVTYKGQTQSFEWTYVDEDTLAYFALKNGFAAKKIAESEYGDFLMQVQKNKII